MKLIVLLNLIGIFHLTAATSYSQNTHLSLHIENSTIKEVLDEIEKNSEFYFLYSSKLIDVDRKVSINVKNYKIEPILSEIFKGENVKHVVYDRQIILTTRTMVQKSTSSDPRQQKTVTGTVTDEDGNPLVGVTVMVKGTTQGTITGRVGKYSLSNVPEDAILTFSFVGMLTQEIEVGDQTTIDVTMKVDAIGIEEVVAVGYATAKKVNLIGSVSTVSSDEIANQTVTSAGQVLSGRVAGVQLIQGSAQPGRDDPTLTIRGVNTIRGSSGQLLEDTAPLVIVDGVQSTLNDIHPQDIENISVLKDASSAAIYGARAANGVILITTKRGRMQRPVFSYNATYGWQNATFIPEVLNPLEFGILKNESRTNVGKEPLFSQDDLDWLASSKHDSWAEFAYIDNAPITDHYLSVSGGSESARYMVSLGYQDQEGVVLNSSSERYNIRSNVDVTISDKFRTGLSLGGSLRDIHQSTSGPLFLVRNSLRHPPYAFVDGLIKEDGYYSRGTAGRYQHGGNTIAEHVVGGMNDQKIYSATPSVYLEYEPVENLVLKTQGSIWITNSRGSAFRNPFFTSNGEQLFLANALGNLNETSSLNTTILVETTATYLKSFGRSEVNGLLGFSDQKFDGENFRASIQGFAPDGLQKLSVGSINPSVAGSGSAWALRSVFGRVGYNFDNKYLAEFNVRYDGSSRFGPENRWGVFPSFSLGWRMSQESFMQDIYWLSQLKLRANWGQLGNQNIGNYSHIATISLNQPYIFGNSVAPGAAVTSLANPNIKWETTTQTNIGMDMSVFDNRFGFELDLYERITDDILLTPPVPRTLGNLDPPTQNQGKVQNRGIEFLVRYIGNTGSEFNYSISANFSHNDNEVLELNETILENKVITKVGYPIASYYGHRILGLFKSDEEAQNTEKWGVQPGGPNHAAGDYIYEDTNGDGVIDADDRVIIGNPNIRNTLGATLTMSYKGFDFRTMFQGVIGRDIEDGVFGNDGMRVLHNAQKKWLDRWTPDNPDTDVPRVGEGITWNSSQWFGPLPSANVLDASYVRLKHLELGYTIPKNLTNTVGISRLRVYLSGQNLLTFTNFKEGFDPEDEFLFNNVNDSYPNAKTIAFGINLDF